MVAGVHFLVRFRKTAMQGMLSEVCPHASRTPAPAALSRFPGPSKGVDKRNSLVPLNALAGAPYQDMLAG